MGNLQLCLDILDEFLVGAVFDDLVEAGSLALFTFGEEEIDGLEWALARLGEGEIYNRDCDEVDDGEDDIALISNIVNLGNFRVSVCSSHTRTEGYFTITGVISTTRKVNSHCDTTAKAPPRRRSLSGSISLG